MLIVYMTVLLSMSFSFFFFNDTATTEIYTLSLHDALPICRVFAGPAKPAHRRGPGLGAAVAVHDRPVLPGPAGGAGQRADGAVVCFARRLSFWHRGSSFFPPSVSHDFF